MAINVGGLTIDIIQPILFGLIFAGLAFLSNRRSGKRKPRDYDLILRSLKGKGYRKWVFVDLILFFALSAAFGFLAYGFFQLLSGFVSPADVRYVGTTGFMVTVLSSMFIGITAPMFVYVPTMKLIHGKRFRKFILYSMTSQRMDTIWLSKVFVLPMFVIACFVGLGGAFMQDYLEDDLLIERGFLSPVRTEHSLLDVEEFYVAEKAIAPNGNQLSRLRIVLKFKDSYVWESKSMDSDFPLEDIRDLARHIYQVSGVKPQAVTYSPFDN